MAREATGLAIKQDMAFQRMIWRLQRFGWAIMTVLLVLAALGFAGGIGPLNTAVAVNDRLEVEYNPYIRRSAPTDLTIKIHGGGAENVRLVIDSSYLNQFGIQRVVPQPQMVTVGDGRLMYEFAKALSVDSVEVTFSLQAKEGSVGMAQGGVALPSGMPVTIKQVVYP